MIHIFGFISQKISILALKVIKEGQSEMFRGLIWGIVRLCRSNITGDIIKNVQNWFLIKCQFWMFLMISPVIFDLQRRTIPQINPLNISLWPSFILFRARIDMFWDMEPNKCIIFLIRLYMRFPRIFVEPIVINSTK